MSADSRQTIAAYDPTENIIDDVLAVKAESNDWYAVAETLHDPAEVLELAAWCEANVKLYITSSSDANIINQTLALDTTSVAALLKEGNYARTAVMYHANDAEFIECAWLGKMLPTAPGSKDV